MNNVLFMKFIHGALKFHKKLAFQFKPDAFSEVILEAWTLQKMCICMQTLTCYPSAGDAVPHHRYIIAVSDVSAVSHALVA